MNSQKWKKILLLLALVSGLNAQEVNTSVVNNTNVSNDHVKSVDTAHESQIKQNLIATAKYTGKAVNFVYRNSGMLLSKNTLATAMILGAPYIYLTDTDILANIATLMSDMTFKISDAAMSGMLRAAWSNKAIVSRLSGIFAAKFVAAEATKTGVSEAVKYGFAALGHGIRGYFGWASMNELVNASNFVKAVKEAASK